jgi:hypothetical protein
MIVLPTGQIIQISQGFSVIDFKNASDKTYAMKNGDP